MWSITMRKGSCRLKGGLDVLDFEYWNASTIFILPHHLMRKKETSIFSLKNISSVLSLLCARHCSRWSGYNSEQNQLPGLWGLHSRGEDRLQATNKKWIHDLSHFYKSSEEKSRRVREGRLLGCIPRKMATEIRNRWLSTGVHTIQIVFCNLFIGTYGQFDFLGI